MQGPRLGLTGDSPSPRVPPFGRVFFGAPERLTRIGEGPLGGKAAGLCLMRDFLGARLPDGRLGDFRVEVPTLTVLTADVFRRFLDLNRLQAVADGDLADDRLARTFQAGSLPADVIGDLRALVEQVRIPLAVRSSSLLEDALGRPFAGVYATKMIPNDQPDADTRFRRLVEAVKFVYASTYFAAARRYRQRSAQPDSSEAMAVVIQEVVGRRHLDRFYPDLSGVARSWSFYRSGRVRPEDGVVLLALGLGKTIVDGDVAWSYSPRYPRIGPPFASARDLLKGTQRRFWAIRMGRPPAFDPIAETEYLVQEGLDAAEFDGTLRHTASTYDAASDRVTPGVGRAGPRAITFAPLLDLESLRLNEAVTGLLRLCEASLGGAVEIEFAATFDDRADPPSYRLGFLQVRRIVVPSDAVDVPVEALAGPEVLAASESVLGNGRVDLRDVVYVKPASFEPARTREVADELASVNRALVSAGAPYLLVGVGRWGSADPWLGIPVTWDQISGAKVIVEAQTESLRPDPSQGSHFFHNLSSFDVSYFCVPLAGRIDWAWLDAQPAHDETRHLRHVHVAVPLRVRVDGRSGRGVILKP